MEMFKSLLSSIPPNRSEWVNDLDIPELPVSPYFWELDSLSPRSDSLLTGTTVDVGGTLSTDSSIPLSRAMTDSEIDYAMFRRYRTRSLSNPWGQMRSVLDNFPTGYLDSLYSYYPSSTAAEEAYSRSRRRLQQEELRRSMERFFERECRVFAPGDAGRAALDDALRTVDFTYLDSDLDTFLPTRYSTTYT